MEKFVNLKERLFDKLEENELTGQLTEIIEGLLNLFNSLLTDIDPKVNDKLISGLSILTTNNDFLLKGEYNKIMCSIDSESETTNIQLYKEVFNNSLYFHFIKKIIGNPILRSNSKNIINNFKINTSVVVEPEYNIDVEIYTKWINILENYNVNDSIGYPILVIMSVFYIILNMEITIELI